MSLRMSYKMPRFRYFSLSLPLTIPFNAREREVRRSRQACTFLSNFVSTHPPGTVERLVHITEAVAKENEEISFKSISRAGHLKTPCLLDPTPRKSQTHLGFCPSVKSENVVSLA